MVAGGVNARGRRPGGGSRPAPPAGNPRPGGVGEVTSTRVRGPKTRASPGNRGHGPVSATPRCHGVPRALGRGPRAVSARGHGDLGCWRTVAADSGGHEAATRAHGPGPLSCGPAPARPPGGGAHPPVVRCGGPRDPQHRAVAQLGSAPEWGSGGRRFKSAQPDHVSRGAALCGPSPFNPPRPRCPRGLIPSALQAPRHHRLGRKTAWAPGGSCPPAPARGPRH